MKKYIISGIIVFGFIFYALTTNKQLSAIPTTSTSENTSTTTSQTETTQTTGLYKDGTYTGTSEDAFYGFIQVRATVTGGKLTDVEFLKYPDDHHESVEINQRAMPILRSEAIAAQSANVDVVSRATDSSEAFIKSLGAALQQAQS